MPTDAKRAVLFDLDGVLTDTAELHYQSWLAIAGELGVPFDRRRNDALRGVSREASLAILLGERHERLSPQQRAELLTRKNDDYLRRVAQMTPADLHAGARPLLESLRARGAALAVASSSRNALCVLERLAIMDLLDAVVDGNDAPRSKPDPMVFLVAAERIGVPPRRCVVVEDAASGVAAAQAARMRVVGVGPPERVGEADRVVPDVGKLTADELLRLLD